MEEHAEQLAALGPTNEAEGKLSDGAVKILRDVGIMRMLAPKTYGGYESHPAEWAEAVMKLGSLDGSTGWLGGIVGIHPWEVALADARVQEEIWGADQDVWVGSPYAPMGVLKPTDGGYLFSGHWQFSSGTDHCDWLFLGAMMGDEDGAPLMPPQMAHVLIPRADYTILHDSWDVVGLKGTGSKDIVVKDAFVPDYRVLSPKLVFKIFEGTAGKEAGLENPLFHLPFSGIFPLGITSAVIGMAEGALAHSLAYQRTRVQVTGTKVKDDPYVLTAIGEASAEIHAARTVLLDNVRRLYDGVAKGRVYTFAERADGRRDQVASCWRAIRAVDELVARSGGNGLRMDNPLQRFWRDAHMGLAHAIHVPGTVNHVSALGQIGHEPPPG
ncbi:MAG: acyl-CoA dehydrogenase family protein, partial [Mycobacteriales bacterium]